MIVLDTEVYKDYFLLSFKEISTGRIKHFEMFDGNELNKKSISRILSNYTSVSFNGLNYDLPMIAAALSGFKNEDLKKLSDKIITGKEPSFKVCRDNQIQIPVQWDHIDILQVTPGTGSLKIYGARLHAPKLQDLPIEPSASISPDMRDLMRRYCENDLHTTELLFSKLYPAILLRSTMSKQYGIDLRSKSDAQIAEAVIKSELTKINGRTFKGSKLPDDVVCSYKNPGIVSFKNPILKDVFNRILSHEFEVSGNGSIKLPTWLKTQKIKIGETTYQMGIGGLHSCEKSQFVEAKTGEFLSDFDVSSYYPSIILQQRLCPKNLGYDFLEVYQSLVTKRLDAKKSGDKVTADTMKISINGSFGKLGNKYSALYSPALLLQTTITGQLCLLMLIERFEEIGVKVVSANTDGVVCHGSVLKNDLVEKVAWDWMLDTSFELERSDYRLMASRDVNNYVAVKLDGSTKGKGCFSPSGLMKNPDRSIVYEAVAKFLSNATRIEETITNCGEITKFLTVRKVTGGAVFNGDFLGKAIRFYASKEVPKETHILYLKNGHRVPKSSGCKPLMDLPEKFPPDVDYDCYIKEAIKVLSEVGYA
jgi:DNA polymerase elongation subunit (family B)